MATKNQKKRAVKKVAKQAKKNPKIFIILFLLLLAIGGVVLVLYFTGTLDNIINKINGVKDAESTQTTPQSTVQPTSSQSSPAQSTGTGAHSHEDEDGIVENIIYDNFQIHFLELGNDKAGDSVYIKAGDNDILIDAGSRRGSAPTLKNYIDQYCTDGKLEYVIATHAHEDHIAGLVGEDSTKSGIFYKYQIDTSIDFALTDVSSALYNTSYVNALTYLTEHGTTHHQVDYYFDSNKNPTSEASIQLAENISMDIIYNRYYFERSSKENNYSVCTMFNYNDKHYLFTGDLEKSGEQSIAAYYDGSTPSKTLPKVELFKAGHHGSETSSNECLLSIIQPKICVACCCAGNTEYTVVNDNIFPTQNFIDRIAVYTSRVYVTTLFDQTTLNYVSMNGNIVVSSNGTKVGLNASNNLIRLKDTEWFNEQVYVVDGKIAKGNKGSKDFYTSNDSGAQLVPRRVWPQNGVQ